MHLEGALSPSLLFTLASRNSIPLPSPQIDPSFLSTSALLERYDRFTSLDDFLHYYFIGMSCLIFAQDFEDLAWDYFQKARSQNVMHAEVFFDPQAHTARGVKYETVVEGFGQACRRAERELGMSTRMILCFLRHLPVDDANLTWRNSLRDLENGTLAGIGLDSSEKGFPPEAWRDIYTDAKMRGIQRTAHAGEEGPVEYIQQALSVCDVQRIDHGIKLADNVELMKEVAEREILVTMCPLSNLKLQCVQKLDQLPVRTFLKHGVRFSINSDDPAYFTSYIQDNYCAVQDAFDLQEDDWSRIGKAAVIGSWIDEPRKAQLLQMIDKAINDHHRQ